VNRGGDYLTKSSVNFRGKTWLYWAILLFFGPAAICMIVMGIECGTGRWADINGNQRPEAAIPLVTIGLFLAGVDALCAYQIIGRRRPVIACYRDGIVCNVIGPGFVGNFYHGVGMFLALAAIVTGRGFRRFEYFIAWDDFGGAEVRGREMSYLLVLFGIIRRTQAAEVLPSLTFRQVEFRNSPNKIASELNWLASNRAERDRLVTWMGNG
jgi:hypothetical protein